MKKIILYVDDDVVDVYQDVFTKKAFDEFLEMPMEMKMKLIFEGTENCMKAKDMKNEKNDDKKFNFLKKHYLYNSFLNMTVVAEHLHDIKVESVE